MNNIEFKTDPRGSAFVLGYRVIEKLGTVECPVSIIKVDRQGQESLYHSCPNELAAWELLYNAQALHETMPVLLRCSIDSLSAAGGPGENDVKCSDYDDKRGEALVAVTRAGLEHLKSMPSDFVLEPATISLRDTDPVIWGRMKELRQNLEALKGVTDSVAKIMQGKRPMSLAMVPKLFEAHMEAHQREHVLGNEGWRLADTMSLVGIKGDQVAQVRNMIQDARTCLALFKIDYEKVLKWIPPELKQMQFGAQPALEVYTGKTNSGPSI